MLIKKLFNIYWSHTGNCDGYKIYKKVERFIFWNLVDTVSKTTFSYNINVTDYGAYTYKVTAFNSGGISPNNPFGTAYVLAPPSGLSAVALSSTSIKLYWNPVDANATSIIILRSENGTDWTNYKTISSSLTIYSDSNCLPSKTYWYALWTKRDKNNSDWSNKVSATTLPLRSPPASPTNLIGTAINCNQIDITWQDNATDETNYIKAKNSYGDSGYSNEINITTPLCGTPPNAPTNLTLNVISSSQINLSWNDNSDNEDGFKVERKEESGSYVLITTLISNTTLFNDSTTSGNKKYYYRVYAFNSYGVSNFSNESIVTTPLCGNKPNAPSNLFGETVSKSEISLPWKDNSDNEDGFILKKEEAGSYNIVTTLPKDTNKYSDKNLLPDKTYYYRIKAFNSFGESDYSNELKIKTPKDIELIILRFYIGKTIYYQNDEMKNMDVAPIILEGRTLLPIRYVAEALGANVEWEAKEQKVTINFKGIVIELWIGKNLATVNGE